MKQNLGILLTSRNNYEMLEQWLNMVNTEGFDVLNIDEDSTPKNKLNGQDICKKYNITYMDREKRGMQNNIATAAKYFNNFKYIIWFQHDCTVLTSQFFTKLNAKINSGEMDSWGTIGFNVFDRQREIDLYDPTNVELMTLARTPLEPGDFWYRSKRWWGNTRADYSNANFRKPFAVESISWHAAGININMFEQYIQVTDKYQFFHAWDDICFQFLYNNIYNVALPQYCVAHNQSLKDKFGIPRHSPKSDNKTREFYHGKWGHHEVWKARWGFDYGDRTTFEKVKHYYKDTLLEAFYNHDPANGPYGFTQ